MANAGLAATGKKEFTRCSSPCFDYGMREGNATTCEWEWRASNASCALREFDAASVRALLRGRHLCSSATP